MSDADANGAGPWYRQPLVWLVIAIPASAVVMGVAMILISVKSFDGMVDDDYYRRGLEINRDLSRDEVAVKRGLSAALKANLQKGFISAEISFPDGKSGPLPQRVHLRLIHPTRAGLDQSLVLDRYAGGAYQAGLAPLAPGNWRVQLNAENWRLTGRMPVPGTGLVDLAPVRGR